MKRPPFSSKYREGFSILEMLVSTAILSIILLIVFSITQQAGDAWTNSASKIESFQSARAAFESMRRRVGQATLNVYYDYYDAANQPRTEGTVAAFVPAKYGRISDLHFISGKTLLNGKLPAPNPNQVTHSVFFQAPTGYTDDGFYKPLDETLNACGYYVVYGPDSARPDFLSTVPNMPASQNRFRLMEFSQPTQKLSLFESRTGANWFGDAFTSGSAPVRQVAANVAALIVRPKNIATVEATTALCPDYEYDSRLPDWSTGEQDLKHHQLPPVVEIVMVAVDEASFSRLGNPATVAETGADLRFQTLALFKDDITALTDSLQAKKLKYQIFTADIPVRSSKWSAQ